MLELTKYCVVCIVIIGIIVSDFSNICTIDQILKAARIYMKQLLPQHL